MLAPVAVCVFFVIGTCVFLWMVTYDYRNYFQIIAAALVVVVVVVKVALWAVAVGVGLGVGLRVIAGVGKD